jgi:hypothetical protein
MAHDNVFQTLSAINLNDKTEKKKDLTYLSWTYAWSEVMKHYPDASYEVLFFHGYPYVYDPITGYMVFTKVTIGDKSHTMWLPVMDGANKSMKGEEYTYATKYGNKTVEAATMFDINKTIMRCLVKNLAMFGLGIYIYSGEDLPEVESAPVQKQTKTVATEEVAELVQDSESWTKVVKYVSDNKALGIEKILQQLSRKYTISATVKKELAKIING